MTSECGAAALAYARRGWAVLPVHVPAPGPGRCSCGAADCASPAKHPRVRGGVHAATTGEAQLERWWGRWPDANVAIRTGAGSGLVVLDVDPRHDGHRSLGRLLQVHGPLPDARTVATGGGGWHVYFAHPGGVVRNDAGRRLGPGLDVRGDGGYVVAPPSRHIGGSRYEVVADGALIPALPPLDSGPSRGPGPGNSSRRVRGGRRVGVGAGGARRGTGPAAVRRPGARNDTLNLVAFKVGQILGAGALDEASVAEVLIEGGTVTGLSEREAAATVRSGLRAGVEHPPPAPAGPAPPARGSTG